MSPDHTSTPALNRRSLFRGSPEASAPSGAPPLPPLSVIVLNRLAFGARPGDFGAFLALAPDPDERLRIWVDQQLDPAAIDDSALDARIAAEGYTTLNKSLAQLWADHIVADPPWSERVRPMRETQHAAMLRAVYSRRQLAEVLADFWHNHFNVFGWDGYTGATFVHYDRDVIRAHMLGNFRQMLEAVARSTTMLYYLDNRTNEGGNPNENFARELFELHTLGSASYLGVMPQEQVPGYSSGSPVGYVDGDVYGATTCFTGWTVDRDTGLFEYDASMHFPYQKFVLGRIIPANQPPLKDGRDVLTWLSRHPGTARHIAFKLCRRLITDNPPTSIIESAAAEFTAHINSPDQLKRVVRHIVLSTEFKSTWGEKIKRPLEVAASVLRALNADFTYTDPFRWWYEPMGQELYNWRAPDGYPDHREFWATTMPMLQRWRLINRIIENMDGTTVDILGQTPAGVRSPTALVDFWIQRILGRTMPASERAPIVDFAAQGRNPDLDLPADERDERLPRLVALILMSPSFQWR